jgi:hypothetical protein
MPNLAGVQLNSAGGLITVRWSAGQTATVTLAEAQAYVDAHPNFSDARIEAQILSLLTSRRVGWDDAVAVHLISRNPLAATIWTGPPGEPVPPTWWAE